MPHNGHATSVGLPMRQTCRGSVGNSHQNANGSPSHVFYALPVGARRGRVAQTGLALYCWCSRGGAAYTRCGPGDFQRRLLAQQVGDSIEQDLRQPAMTTVSLRRAPAAMSPVPSR